VVVVVGVIALVLFGWYRWHVFSAPHAWYIQVERTASSSTGDTHADMLYSHQAYADKTACDVAASALESGIPSDPDTDISVTGLYCEIENTADANHERLYEEYILDSR